MNVNAENTKQLSAPQKLPGLSRNRPLEPRYIGWSKTVGKLSKDIIVCRVKYEETRAASKIPRFQASHQLLTANFKMATKGESDWMKDSLQCRRFLLARNLLAEAPCWNFPKRGGDGASQRERGGGGNREEIFFLPFPSLLSFFRPRTYRKGYYFYSPQSSTVIN